MKNITVVFHSEKGHTKKIAEAIVEGILLEDKVSAHLISINEVEHKFALLDKADAIVFGSPTYMGSVSGPFKMFMDSTSSRWFERSWVNKLAAGFTSSGSLSGDKLGTLSALSVFASQHGMIWVGPDRICEEPIPDDKTVNRLGSNLGVMSQSNPFEPPKTSVPAGDLETARLFGTRIAKTTNALNFSTQNEEDACLA